MALPKSLCDREQDRFREAADGRAAVAVIGGQIAEAATAVSTGVAGSGDADSPAIDVSTFNSGFLVASWTGFDESDATFVIELSDDLTTWQQLGESGTPVNGDIPDGVQVWQILEFTSRYIRLKFTANANSAGSFDIQFTGRS